MLCLEAERIHQEETLTKFKDTLQRQKQDNKELFDKLAALEQVDHRLEMCEKTVLIVKLYVYVCRYIPVIYFL